MNAFQISAAEIIDRAAPIAEKLFDILSDQEPGDDPRATIVNAIVERTAFKLLVRGYDMAHKEVGMLDNPISKMVEDVSDAIVAVHSASFEESGELATLREKIAHS